MSEAPQSIDIEGIRLPCLTLKQSLDRVLSDGLSSADRSELIKVGWLNAHCANVRRNHSAYAQALGTFQHVYNDGVGVQLAARMQGHKFPDNLNGTDWIPAFLSRLEEERNDALLRVFLLGAKEEALQAAASQVKVRWPGLKIVGTRSGYFTDEKEVVSAITAARTQVLLVGMGVPRQELFLAEHAEQLFLGGVRIAVAGGAIFDFLGGTVRRAPKLVRALHSEWVWRLGLEPVRLAHRYLVGNPVFLYHALRYSSGR